MNRYIKEILVSEQYDKDLFEKYISQKGMRKVKLKELDKIVDRFGTEVLAYVAFRQVYTIVSNRESNVNTRVWSAFCMFMGIIIALLIAKL